MRTLKSAIENQACTVSIENGDTVRLAFDHPPDAEEFFEWLTGELPRHFLCPACGQYRSWERAFVPLNAKCQTCGCDIGGLPTISSPVGHVGEPIE